MCKVFTKKQNFLLKDIKEKWDKWKEAPCSGKEWFYTIKVPFSINWYITYQLKSHQSFSWDISRVVYSHQGMGHRKSSQRSLTSSLPPSPGDGIWASVPVHPNNTVSKRVLSWAYDWLYFSLSWALCFWKRRIGENRFLLFLLLRNQSLFNPGIWPGRT